MKKILNIILVMIMMFTVTTVNADTTTTGKITITREATNAKVTYNAYRLFDLQLAADNKSYNYTINSEWLSFFGITDVTTDAGSFEEPITTNAYITYYIRQEKVIVVAVKGADSDAKSATAKSLAEAAIKAVSGKTKYSSTEVDTATTVTIENLPLGYYLVDSTLGALVHLDTTDTEAEITEKNEEPVPEKIVNVSYAEVGQTVTYTINVPVKKGAINYELSDTMTKGLTYVADSIEIKVDGTAVDTTNYTYTTSPTTTKADGTTKLFVIKFSDTYVASIAGKTIVVTYKANVNEDAIETNSAKNTATLKYGNNEVSKSTEVETKLLNVEVTKTDDSTPAVNLTGAEFSLWNAKTGGTAYKIIKVEEGVYRLATAEENADANVTSVPIVAGEVTIKGLDAKTYYLQEDKEPTGYNKLSARIALDLSGKTNIEKTVVNTTNTILPSTGGIGTLMFILIGSIMATCIGVVLVTKFRMTKENA